MTIRKLPAGVLPTLAWNGFGLAMAVLLLDWVSVSLPLSDLDGRAGGRSVGRFGARLSRAPMSAGHRRTRSMRHQAQAALRLESEHRTQVVLREVIRA